VIPSVLGVGGNDGAQTIDVADNKAQKEKTRMVVMGWTVKTKLRFVNSGEKLPVKKAKGSGSVQQ
jgi:hypothetical protein